MAVDLSGKEYTVTGSAVSLTSALGLGVAKTPLSHITFRAATANAGNVFLGRGDVTVAANRLVFLKPDESFSIALENGFVFSDTWFIIGTPGDKLHIAALQ